MFSGTPRPFGDRAANLDLESGSVSGSCCSTYGSASPFAHIVEWCPAIHLGERARSAPSPNDRTSGAAQRRLANAPECGTILVMMDSAVFTRLEAADEFYDLAECCHRRTRSRTRPCRPGSPFLMRLNRNSRCARNSSVAGLCRPGGRSPRGRSRRCCGTCS